MKIENNKLAQLIIACIQQNMSDNNFELRDENWYELKLNFKFDTKDGKITNLDIQNPKIVKSVIRNKSRKNSGKFQ